MSFGEENYIIDVFQAMKYEIPIRIKVLRPLAGVAMKVQRGRAELLPPTKVLAESIAFDFEITVDVGAATPNFLGKYTQGPKDARFIYVNSGTYAGHMHTCWSRRAKISLMGITRAGNINEWCRRRQRAHVCERKGRRMEAH